MKIRRKKEINEENVTEKGQKKTRMKFTPVFLTKT